MKMRVLALLALLAVCSGTRMIPLLGEGQDGTTIVDLGGKDWRVASSNGSISAAASVPGVIHLDLLKAKVIEDPYVRYRDVEYRWIALTDWTYSRRFRVSADLLAHAEVVLVCEGLDTVASVAINGKVIGYADNMFRRYLFTVPTDLLRSGPDNTITVSFTSAETYAKARPPPPNHLGRGW
ncbi:Mannosidase, beta A, lysosomal, putative [Acanthamoeba castellanii str. Neff]|uniref:Mannosidase, beta A, lysosomal, putative n=1 Tax=Acanthamoeba castellanii (strain ATCC 30010 / Neff) TaxID=1257118 RepID=L8HEN9_ACACF|nr:Mannosidase, beta A, lysosomal, putative [Acanthamoeba castellanii str. Neff]ELR23233.1 Mannosidase, beta A, lysosomal, putative [Acanthamoeba castellanii str. Neff]